MAQFIFFHEFWNHLGQGVHNFSSHSLRVALTNTAPDAAANSVLADITQITAQNGYVAGGPTLDAEAWAETGAGTGIWQLTSSDEILTATGGSIGPFRYVVLYNDTPTSPADPLIGYLDFTQNITITDTNTFTADVGANGWFRLGTGTLS